MCSASRSIYNEPGGSPEGKPGVSFRSSPGPGSGRHAFVSTIRSPTAAGAEFGMAIFSRFPIVRRGTIPFGKLSQNHAMWADLARPAARTGHRPPRYHSRLQPAPAKHEHGRKRHCHRHRKPRRPPPESAQPAAPLPQRGRGPGHAGRYRAGPRAAARPTPCCWPATTNDLPYSYPYDQLADHLQNAWATAGLGFGATYHGRLPRLRIDQQFASPQWQVLGCRVHREIKWSDHYPLEAVIPAER